MRVNSARKKWVSKSVIVQVASGEGRVGFTVTKRTSKLAVTRNRIKRRLRAAAKDVMPDIAQTGFDYVLIGRPETKSVDYKTLCKDLSWCVRRLDSQ